MDEKYQLIYAGSSLIYSEDDQVLAEDKDSKFVIIFHNFIVDYSLKVVIFSRRIGYLETDNYDLDCVFHYTLLCLESEMLMANKKIDCKNYDKLIASFSFYSCQPN